jgi:extradiol dioxygenase family protein
MAETRGINHLGLAVRDLALTKTFFVDLLGKGSRKHIMCSEPGGIRIEFIWQGV